MNVNWSLCDACPNVEGLAANLSNSALRADTTVPPFIDPLTPHWGCNSSGQCARILIVFIPASPKTARASSSESTGSLRTVACVDKVWQAACKACLRLGITKQRRRGFFNSNSDFYFCTECLGVARPGTQEGYLAGAVKCLECSQQIKITCTLGVAPSKKSYTQSGPLLQSEFAVCPRVGCADRIAPVLSQAV